MDTQVSVYLENVQDRAGNTQEGMVSWGFKIEPFDLASLAVILSLHFRHLEPDVFTSDPAGFESKVMKEACSLMGCASDGSPRRSSASRANSFTVHARVHADFVWVDLEMPDSKGSLPLAAKLYQRLGNATTPSTIPDTMLLSGAEMYQVSYRSISLSPQNIEQSDPGNLEETGSSMRSWIVGIIGGISGLLVGLTVYRIVHRNQNQGRVVPILHHIRKQDIEPSHLPTGKIFAVGQGQRVTDTGMEPEYVAGEVTFAV
jgi:hypothetical protein